MANKIIVTLPFDYKEYAEDEVTGQEQARFLILAALEPVDFEEHEIQITFEG